jgi:hemoglobin
MNIEEKPAFDTAFEWIGGEARVQELVDRFYDLMDLEPSYAQLRATHAPLLDGARQKLFWFLCGWLGGPQHYVERFGHPRLKMRHMPFKVGVVERDQWLACMAQAMAEVGVPQDLQAKLKLSFFQTADWMRNQPDA